MYVSRWSFTKNSHKMLSGPDSNLLMYPSTAVNYISTCSFVWVSNFVIHFDGVT